MQFLEPQSRGILVFEDEFENNQYAWPLGETEWWAASIEDGQLYVTTKSQTGGSLFPARTNQYGDFWVEVKVETLGRGTLGSVGVAFRAADVSSDFYVFEVTYDGKIHLGHLLRGNVTGWDYSRSIEKAPASNVMVVACEGENIALFVNGVKISQVSDDYRLRGRIGLWVGEGQDVRFEYVRIWQEP
jgi:hypothetical protein